MIFNRHDKTAFCSFLNGIFIKRLNGIHIVNADLNAYDVIYYDAFAPEKQPELWSAELLGRVARSLRRGGVLSTYCAKGEVRRRLQQAGLTVQRTPGPPGGKREILQARRPDDASRTGT